MEPPAPHRRATGERPSGLTARPCPPRARVGRSAVLRRALLALLVLGVLLAPLRAARAAPPPTPFAAAVLPFEDRRHPGQPSWLGHYLRERIAKALLRAPQAAVLGLDAAAQWQRTLGIAPTAPLTAAQLERMGVHVVVQGATHTVLGLAEIELHIRTAADDLLAGDAGRFRVNLAEEFPGTVLRRVLEALQGALLPEGSLHEPRAPADWQAVQSLYALLAEPIPAGDRGARPARVARLQPWLEHPALGGRVHEALATLLLEQALLYQPEGAARQQMLGGALRHATAALQADPQDTHRQALKGELHYFLEQYHEAKTEASIARIRNPLEGLAFVVLALVEGLSTGAAHEYLQRALAVEPFLRTEARARGSAPYQGGILEASFRTWDELRARGGLARRQDYPQILSDAIAAFDNADWEEAERLFREAAQKEEGHHVPWLYLSRILMEIGHAGEAVAPLRRLAREYPQEADVQHYLGVALLESGDAATAAAAFSRALALRPDDARSHFHLAQARMELERWPEAMRSLRAVLHADPERAEAWLRLAEVHMRLEDWPAAEEALERVLNLAPGTPEARQRLAAVRRNLEGDDEAAAR